MFETIRIFLYSENPLPGWMKRSIAVPLLVILLTPAVSAVWGAQFEIDRLEKALAAPPYVPPVLQDLANSFLEHTLPKLVADDERLARQLGFGDAMSNQVSIDRTFSMMLIRRNDVFSLIKGKARPLDLVNNANNWLEDEGGRLVPRRIVFLLKAHKTTPEAEDNWSSVTMEQSVDGSSWRIIQVGAPKLSQAMNQYGGTERNSFLLWIPDLNRHYLGNIQNHLVTLKVLFKDRLLNGDPNDNQPIDSEYLLKLKRLYEELDLPKKIRPKTDETQSAQAP